MPKTAIGCPSCGTTTWVTAERGTYEREVVFYTDEPDMEAALDFGDPIEDADGAKFDEGWTCLNGHEAEPSVVAWINELLEEEADTDDEDVDD